MKVPEYFYYRVRSAKKGTALEVEYVPDADVVEVVRCVDCKYCRIWEGHAPYMCECRHMNNIRALHKADHFCGYGERREGDGT